MFEQIMGDVNGFDRRSMMIEGGGNASGVTGTRAGDSYIVARTTWWNTVAS